MPKPLHSDVDSGAGLMSWQVREYESHERGVFWYIGLIFLGIVFVLYGMFSGNFLFSLIIILAAIILFLQSHQEAQHIDFTITDLGVVVSSRFYSYSELDSFYIIYQPPEIKTLFIETKSAIRPMIRIPLVEENPIEVRSLLRQFLHEDIEKEEEPLSDTFARRWKIH